MELGNSLVAEEKVPRKMWKGIVQVDVDSGVICSLIIEGLEKEAIFETSLDV